MTEQVVFKYKLESQPGCITGNKVIQVPAESQFLCAHVQSDTISLWYLVDPAKPKVDKLIYVIGTGWFRDLEGFRYLDTVFTFEETFVWHIFERTMF